jgi:putative phosphoribosyl transferase
MACPTTISGCSAGIAGAVPGPSWPVSMVTAPGQGAWSAAEPGAGIAAVVSRGGRPDLARPRLAAVTAPVLLIVGGHDEVVLDLNRRAQAELRCENDLAVVPGATHLFEEPGTLDAAAGLARDWFLSHLPHGPASAR